MRADIFEADFKTVGEVDGNIYARYGVLRKVVCICLNDVLAG